MRTIATTIAAIHSQSLRPAPKPFSCRRRTGELTAETCGAAVRVLIDWHNAPVAARFRYEHVPGPRSNR